MLVNLGLRRILKSGSTLAQQVAALFSAGEQGAWYDPSDFSTMFQDAAGSIPVTAVGQAVGLLLDKSKSLALSSQLITNGTFDSNITGWTTGSANSNISWNNGKLRVSTTALGSVGKSAYQAFPVIAGKWYVISGSATLLEGTVTTVQVALRDGISAETSSAVASSTLMLHTVSSGTFYYYADTTRTLYLHCRIFNTTQPCTVDFDNVSAKEIVGNHATQTTDTKRPVLSALVNMLTKTEQFNDAQWTKGASAVTPNTTTAPDGTLSADTFIPNSGIVFSLAGSAYVNSTSLIFQSANVVATTYKYRLRVKYNGYDQIQLRVSEANSLTGVNAAVVRINLTNGTILSQGATGNLSVVSTVNTIDNDGWCDITLTFTSGIVQTLYFGFWVWNSSAITSDGIKGVSLWGADLRTSNVNVGIPSYQRVNTGTDYDTTGFPPYLLFDGIDDALQTASINFTGTDKVTVWAGVRKLSDVASGLLVELSLDTATNTGTFAAFAPSSNGANSYKFFSRGNGIVREAGTGVFAAAPDTSVITGIGDISSDIVQLRRNATLIATNTLDQGTGNYGNYPLYIGSRGGTTLPFNGRLYSLIVRGAQSTDTQITNTEAYVNSRTGAY